MAIIPALTFSGSHAPSMIDSYYHAKECVDAAIKAVSSIDFHARDYSNMQEFEDAKIERNRHLESLHNASLYLEDMAIAFSKLIRN